MLSTRLVFALFLGSTAALAAGPDAARQQQLVHLVRQDCGSCHGMTLKDKPPAGLAATIYYGRPGTPMPPWKRFISEDEAAWIVQELMTGFPQ